MRIFNVLGIAGSLREKSLNRWALRLAQHNAPRSLALSVYPALGALPLFNPDIEASPPAPVVAFKRAIDAADALIIASPEYAHGMSGVMKNALDWLVGHEGFVNKPVVVFNTSPRAHHAQDALHEVLKTMSANVIVPACCVLPMLGSTLSAADLEVNEVVLTPLRIALDALVDALRELHSTDPI